MRPSALLGLRQVPYHRPPRNVAAADALRRSCGFDLSDQLCLRTIGDDAAALLCPLHVSHHVEHDVLVCDT